MVPNVQYFRLNPVDERCDMELDETDPAVWLKLEVGMVKSVELPGRLAILPFRNKVLLPGAIIRIRCTSSSSVKLVEQELWQREEK
ncbi:hypothetical protein ACS0TY_032601 [Phlomoides rotata]